MPVFPPPPAIAIVVDGRRVRQYARATIVDGRAYVPVAPAVWLIADSVSIDGATLVARRAGHTARAALVWLAAAQAPPSVRGYVAIAPLARALGEGVIYRSNGRVLEIRVPALAAVGTTPAASAPPAPGAPVFTPEPIPTPRPVWSGSPLPRRTPLPFPPPALAGRVVGVSGVGTGIEIPVR